jgi:HK97 family phage prohead protease
MNRAYSLIEVKSFDEARRTFKGWATTPALDRVDDTINPLKAAFAPEIILLHQHKHDVPIGHVRFGKPTKNGIPFEAEVPLINEPPTLKERVDVAWGELKHRLVRAVSIGFRPTEDPIRNAKGGVDFQGIEIYELSTVTIPANSEAIITAIKSFDEQAREAAGVEDDPLPEIPSEPDPLPEGKKAVVVRLGKAAQDRAPFVINKIHTEGKP